jgi:N-acetyl-anhydromuramyl-L-alanine amidase AmpD
MGLLEAGYHFAVARDGKVFTLRHHMSIGTHTPGHNHDSLGVCLIGGRDDSGNPAENFSEGQIESLVRLLRVWASRMGAGTVGDIPVVGHSEIQRFRNRSHPPCPFLDMEELRRRLVGDRR